VLLSLIFEDISTQEVIIIIYYYTSIYFTELNHEMGKQDFKHCKMFQLYLPDLSNVIPHLCEKNKPLLSRWCAGFPVTFSNLSISSWSILLLPNLSESISCTLDNTNTYCDFRHNISLSENTSWVVHFAPPI